MHFGSINVSGGWDFGQEAFGIFEQDSGDEEMALNAWS